MHAVTDFLLRSANIAALLTKAGACEGMHAMCHHQQASSCLACAVASLCQDAQCKDTLDVRTMQLLTNH